MADMRIYLPWASKAYASLIPTALTSTEEEESNATDWELDRVQKCGKRWSI